MKNLTIRLAVALLCLVVACGSLVAPTQAAIYTVKTAAGPAELVVRDWVVGPPVGPFQYYYTVKNVTAVGQTVLIGIEERHPGTHDEIAIGVIPLPRLDKANLPLTWKPPPLAGHNYYKWNFIPAGGQKTFAFTCPHPPAPSDWSVDYSTGFFAKTVGTGVVTAPHQLRVPYEGGDPQDVDAQSGGPPQELDSLNVDGTETSVMCDQPDCESVYLPTIGEWGVISLIALLLVTGLIVAYRQRRKTAQS